MASSQRYPCKPYTWFIRYTFINKDTPNDAKAGESNSGEARELLSAPCTVQKLYPNSHKRLPLELNTNAFALVLQVMRKNNDIRQKKIFFFETGKDEAHCVHCIAM